MLMKYLFEMWEAWLATLMLLVMVTCGIYLAFTYWVYG